MAHLASIVAGLIPAILLFLLARFGDKRREPWHIVTITFVLGGVGALATAWLIRKAALWTALDIRSDIAGNRGALLFIFAFISPVREFAKVAAMWPAFRSKHFDEPLDGVVYSSAAALGFAAVNGAVLLHSHPYEGVWFARVALALPAHLFFAALWGYALGRVKSLKTPGPIFPAAWTLATLSHGLYAHLVFGRAAGALLGVVPLLLVMGIVSAFGYRDLMRRGDRNDRHSVLLDRPSLDLMTAPPSLRSVRDAMRREGQPIVLRWIVFGAVVTLGAMVAGFAAAVAFGHWAHVDFAAVDERDVSSTAPAALLGAGLLGAFPLSGYLVAKASALPTLLEPALSVGLALMLSLVLLGIAAPVALVFALAFSPIAFTLACAGAWVGRPPPARTRG